MTSPTESKFLPDTSCLVPALQSLHPDHTRCASEIEVRLTRGERMVLAAHSLVETYSVLTRLPPPMRAAPVRAWEAIEGLLAAGEVVAPDPPSLVGLLARASGRAVAGGAIFDFVIASTAVDSAVDEVLTLNTRDFERFRLPIRVVAPPP